MTKADTGSLQQKDYLYAKPSAGNGDSGPHEQPYSEKHPCTHGYTMDADAFLHQCPLLTHLPQRDTEDAAEKIFFRSSCLQFNVQWEYVPKVKNTGTEPLLENTRTPV